MSLKIYASFLAMFLMLVSPALSVIFSEKGQAEYNEPESEPTKVEVSLLQTETDAGISLDLEEYVCGVLLGEITSDYPEEAVMANAVAVRSYVLRRVLSENNHIEHETDVCDSPSHCMAYISRETAIEKWGEEIGGAAYDKIYAATEKTKGKVLYYNGEIAECVFHASSNKYTLSAEEVWGEDIP